MPALGQQLACVASALTVLLAQACGSHDSDGPRPDHFSRDAGVKQGAESACSDDALAAALEASQPDAALGLQIEEAFCREMFSSSCSLRVGKELTGSEQRTEWERFCVSREAIAPAAPLPSPPPPREGLHCQVSDQGFIEVAYHEIAQSGMLTRTTITSTNLTVINPELASPVTYVGDTILAVTITDPAQESIFELSGLTELSDTLESCKVVIPAIQLGSAP